MPLLQFELLPLTGEDTHQAESFKRVIGPGLPDGGGYGYGAFDTHGLNCGYGRGDGNHDTSGGLRGRGHGFGGDTYTNNSAGTLEGTGKG